MRFKEIEKVLLVILFLNWFVAFAKIIIGFFSGALSIMADGVHSLFDGFSNILGLFGIKIAQRPADKTHPYGYRKYEALAAMGIIFLLIIVAYELSKSIVERFINPTQPEISIFYFLILFICISIDWFVAKYEYKKGVELKSTILIADSFHTKSHILTTVAVIAGAIFVKIGFPIMDPIIASFVVFIILKLGYEVFKESSGVLSDKATIDNEKIEKILNGISGISSFHEIRSRGDENHTFLDVHICLDSELSLEKAHDISFLVKETIKKEFSQIQDIVVYIEPETDNEVFACK